MGVRGREKLRRAWTCEEVAERLRPLFEDESIRLVILFGSLAGGEGEGAGDIDIAVGADDGLDVIGLTNRITRLLREDAVDVVDLRGAPPLLKARRARAGRVRQISLAGLEAVR